MQANKAMGRVCNISAMMMFVIGVFSQIVHSKLTLNDSEIHAYNLTTMFERQYRQNEYGTAKKTYRSLKKVDFEKYICYNDIGGERSIEKHFQENL